MRGNRVHIVRAILRMLLRAKMHRFHLRSDKLIENRAEERRSETREKRAVVQLGSFIYREPIVSNW